MDGRKWKILLSGIFAIALVVSIGLALMEYTLEIVDKSQRESLLFRAGTIALTLDPSSIQMLSGSAADLNTENYETLKRSLIEIRALNRDVRFVYILGLRNNKQFFYVDSEDPSSADYSFPGQPYEDALPEDIANHKAGNSYTFGPYSDSWGEWVSAYAPIKTQDGKVVGMVGLDIAAEDIKLRLDGIELIAWILIGLISLAIVCTTLFAMTSAPESIAKKV